MAVVKTLAYLAFIIAIPLFLVISNLRVVVNTPLLYSYGFDRYDIARVTGIERDELLSAGSRIRDYFNNEERWLNVQVRIRGEEPEPLYNTTEILHMWDVKVLIRTLYNVQFIVGLYIVLFIPVGLAVAPREFPRILLRLAAWGAAATLAVVFVTGLLSLTGFSQTFYFFHVIAFTNELWMLDPTRDFLIMMFPEGFFFDATMILVVVTVLQALGLLIVSSFVLGKTRSDLARDDRQQASPRLVQAQFDKVPEHLERTPEERAAASGRSVRSERLADIGIVGYYIVEGALLAVVPALLQWRRSRPEEPPA